MELLILPDQFIIKYPPLWMMVFLLSGLLLFFTGKHWREKLRSTGKHSFVPAVLTTISFIFFIGGINLYVYKLVFNKEGILLFNIKNFNKKIKWHEIKQVDYQKQHNIQFYLVNNEVIVINLDDLDSGSMDKVKTLITYKTRKNKNTKQ